MGAAMLKRTHYFTTLLSLSIVMALTTPIITHGGEAGKDWYCPDHEEHVQYQKHLKHHLDKAAEAITETLDKIYSDPALSKDEKKAKTIVVLDKYLSRMKAGIGD